MSRAAESDARRLTTWVAWLLDSGPVELTPLTSDGGARRYFRVAGRNLLALHGSDQAENLAWLRIGRHLWYKGLALPRIHDYNLGHGFFLLEDLGDVHLADPTNHSALFPEAVELLARLHREGLDGFNPDWCHQTQAYDRAMIAGQEVGYFLQSLLLGYLGWPDLPRGIKAETGFLARLAAPRSEDRVLMHRDYQGRNLMIKPAAEAPNGPMLTTGPAEKTVAGRPVSSRPSSGGARPQSGRRVFFIDWQGARPGPAAYDLVSLLEETPYVPLTEEYKEELIKIYLNARGRGPWQKSFREEMIILSAPRLMQALGAYAKLTLAGKSKFAGFMWPVAERLRGVLSHPLLASSCPLLRAAAAEAAAQLKAKQ